jgi:hypothetical protein
VSRWADRVTLAGPWMAIGAAAAAVVSLGLGGQLPGWMRFLWPALAATWAGLVLYQRSHLQWAHGLIETQRRLIDHQRQIIRQGSELSDSLLRYWRPR